MGRRNRPSHPAPRRNRSRRAALEVSAQAQFDRDPTKAQAAKGSRREVPSRTVVRCATGKVGFPTEHAAEERLEEIRSDERRRRRSGVPQRIYRCPHCDSFHFTSEAKG